MSNYLLMGVSLTQQQMNEILKQYKSGNKKAANELAKKFKNDALANTSTTTSTTPVKTTSTSTTNTGTTNTSKNNKSNDVSNIVPYTATTGDTPAGTASKGSPSNLSYVQSTNYSSSGEPWDYKADISRDANRAKEMAYNLRQDMVSNPKLFTNRDDYNKYYHYDERSDSQKKLLDAFFANANKYGLGATDNFYADMASSAADDKNKKLYQEKAAEYNRLLPELNGIRDKLNDRLGPVFDKLMDAQTKYLKDMAYLRKLQMQHYQGMTEEANNRAAGRSASMGSTLSGQGLSSSAIASSSLGIEKNWVEELNNNMEEHIKTMKELADAEGTFTNNWGNVMSGLTSTEQNALTNWYNAFKTLEDGLNDTYNTMVKEHYSPYEVLTQAKVSGAAETLTSTGKLNTKQSEYQKTSNPTEKNGIIYNQLYGLFSSYPELFAKFAPYITTAVEQYPNDWEKAMTTVLAKGGVKDTSKVINSINSTTDWTKPGSIIEALGL